MALILALQLDALTTGERNIFAENSPVLRDNKLFCIVTALVSSDIE